ncbi:MAG TPA: hypothetical protein VN176_03400 [Verrucomicrobiae bacterium]|jgi:hypothetical protein|nr:hypothetical protein [Verrucomicrobiae bacterium]
MSRVRFVFLLGLVLIFTSFSFAAQGDHGKQHHRHHKHKKHHAHDHDERWV